MKTLSLIMGLAVTPLLAALPPCKAVPGKDFTVKIDTVLVNERLIGVPITANKWKIVCAWPDTAAAKK